MAAVAAGAVPDCPAGRLSNTKQQCCLLNSPATVFTKKELAACSAFSVPRSLGANRAPIASPYAFWLWFALDPPPFFLLFAARAFGSERVLFGGDGGDAEVGGGAWWRAVLLLWRGVMAR